jgi:hypothetical protein
MKLFGSLKELVSAVFRKDGKEVTLGVGTQGGAGTNRTFNLPAVTSAVDYTHVIVVEDLAQTLTNKTIDGDNNTLQDIGLSSIKTVLADANKALLRDASGIVTSSFISNDNVAASAGIVDTKLATISTAGKVSNSATTATSANTASAIVARDSSNNFSAGTITASLSGNASTATDLASGSILSSTKGGTGINNGGTLTYGANNISLTTSGATSLTLPTSGTMATLAGSETLLNKVTVSSTALATGALKLPTGTSAEQPGSPSQGMIRFNSTDTSFEGYDGTAWSGIGGGGTKDRVSQASHGFVAGDTLYLNGSTYTKAIATSAATAEVVGVVSRVIDSSTFEITLSGEVSGLSGLTVGEVYFLSAATAGALTVTEPSVIGQVSVPVGIASSTTSLYVAPKRGVVVGGSNARTELPLSNNASTTIYTTPTGLEAGELKGWVYLDATTDYRFFLSAQFARNGANSDWNLSYQTTGDTPPAGFNVTISSAANGVISIVLPSLVGFVSGKINYALNAPAVGVTFPLAIDASLVTTGTLAEARLPTATATARGAVYASRFQTKILASNVQGNGSQQTISGLTFNNLTAGKTYRVSGYIYLVQGVSNIQNEVAFFDGSTGGTRIGSAQANAVWSSGFTELNQGVGVSFIFTAANTTMTTSYTAANSASVLLVGNGTKSRSFITLEEVDMSSTTAWT